MIVIIAHMPDEDWAYGPFPTRLLAQEFLVDKEYTPDGKLRPETMPSPAIGQRHWFGSSSRKRTRGRTKPGTYTKIAAAGQRILRLRGLRTPHGRCTNQAGFFEVRTGSDT
jgi:hypothetical protein